MRPGAGPAASDPASPILILVRKPSRPTSGNPPAQHSAFNKVANHVAKLRTMKIVAELLTALDETMRTVKGHLAEMDTEQLNALVGLLAPRPSIGSAEMVLTILALREIEARNPAKS